VYFVAALCLMRNRASRNTGGDGAGLGVGAVADESKGGASGFTAF